jgi:hypothetical protein
MRNNQRFVKGQSNQYEEVRKAPTRWMALIIFLQYNYFYKRMIDPLRKEAFRGPNE